MFSTTFEIGGVVGSALIGVMLDKYVFKNIIICLYRGSYMSANVLLNLLNKLGKRDKMLDKPHIVSPYCNKVNKFINTEA